MTSAFEQEIKRQIEAKQAQRFKEKLVDQKQIIDQYKNYPLGGGSYAFDLPASALQREQQIYSQLQQLPGLNSLSDSLERQVPQMAAFQGDMNQPVRYSQFDQKPVNLFDQQFIKPQSLQSQKEYGSGLGQDRDLSKMSDRERRLFLRERERQLRNQKPAAGISVLPQPEPSEVPYGGSGGPTATPPQKVSPRGELSKRELMLEMKAQQRRKLTGQQPVPHLDFDQFQQPQQQTVMPQNPELPLNFHPAENQDVPEFQQPLSFHINQVQNQPEQPLLPQQSPHRNRNPEEPLKVQPEQFSIGKHADQTAQRRQEQNSQRQEDYRKWLIQQEAKRQLAQELPSDHPMQSLLGGIGDHQYAQKENKVKRQQAYADDFRRQAVSGVQDTPQLSKDKKRMLAEEIFNDMLIESQRGEPQQNPPQQPFPLEAPQRSQPPPSSRQYEFEKLQMQQTKQMFGQDDDQRLREREEKKREYALQLQQQMLAKQTPSRGASARHQPQQPDFYPSPQQNFNAPPAQQAQYYQTPQHQAPTIIQTAQYPANEYPPSAAESKQAEYRRVLEQQIREQADKKLKQKQDEARYEEAHQQNLADYITQSQPVPQSNRRGQSDITRTPKQENQAKLDARLKYQAELRQQMEEQKAKKIEQQRKAKLDAFEEDQRLQRERERLAGRERKEITEEGGKPLPAIKPSKMVNRAQFEQSEENGGPALAIRRFKQPIVEELLISSPPLVDMSHQPTTLNSGAEPTLQHNFPSQFNYPPTPTSQPPSQPQINQPSYTYQPPQQLFLSQQPQQPFIFQLPYPPQLQQPQSQIDWQQQHQKMFEDQQRMIACYQQALEQILTYRNQYFEQAMEMRENALREREQMLEYEKLKQQQALEIQQLQAVRQQLHNVSQTKQELAPQLQTHLNSYIAEQREQIMSISQSQGYYRDILAQTPTINDEELLQSEELEMSLTAMTKLVKVPARTKPQQEQRLATAERDAQLLATWNENSVEKHLPLNRVNTDAPIADLCSPIVQKKSQQFMSASTTQLNDRKVTITGSSFYDQTMKNQKIKDETQQVEMQKQLERIFGGGQTTFVPESLRSFDSVRKQQQLGEPDTPSLHVVESGSERQEEVSPAKSAAVGAIKNQFFHEVIASTGQTKVYELPSDTADDIQMTEKQDKAAAAEFQQILEEARMLQRELQTPSSQKIRQDVDSQHRPLTGFSDTQEFQVPIVENNQNNGMLRESYSVVDQSSPREQHPTPRESPLQGIERRQNVFGVYQSQKNLVISEGQPYSAREDETAGEQYTSFPAESTVMRMTNEDDVVRKSNQVRQSWLTDGRKSSQDVAEDPETLKRRQKENEMREIAELIRRAQQSTIEAVQQAERQSKQRQLAQVAEQSESSPDKEDGERNILADLDKIINNLEAQKNMATFGQAGTESPVKKSSDLFQVQEHQFEASSQSVINIAQGECIHHDFFEQKETSPHQMLEEPVKKWRTLQEARENRPTTGKSSRSQGKAPLVPRTTSKDPDSKSRASARDANSPQHLGKFSQMALQRQQLSDKSQERSQTSKSPQRIGHYAQMAMVNVSRRQTGDQDRSFTSKSPQRVGKYAQMAATSAGEKSNISQDRSFTSKSPQRVGKFAQMALDSSRRSNGSHDSPSLRAGKFAQLAMNKSDISQDDLSQLSRKYSNERLITPVQRTDKRQTVTPSMQQQSLLRPVTTSNYSSRYQAPQEPDD